MPISTSTKDPFQLILESEIQDLIKESVAKNLLELYAVGSSDEEVWEELRALVGPTVVWVKSSQSHLQFRSLRNSWMAKEKFQNNSEICNSTESHISRNGAVGNCTSNSLDLNRVKGISTNINDNSSNRNGYRIDNAVAPFNETAGRNVGGGGGGGGGGGARLGFSLSKFSELSLEEVLGTEETVWCPPLGIKGQIDLVVKARILSNSVSASSDTNKNKKYNNSVIMPLELKTGKASMQIAHRAQVMLYVLMLVLREHSASDLISEENSMSETKLLGNANTNAGDNMNDVMELDPSQSRQQYPPTHGLLLYLNRDGTKCETITPKWQEICSLVISRNDLAGHIKHSSSLVRIYDLLFTLHQFLS